MDPSSLNDEESYPSANVQSHNLAEIWHRQMNGYSVIAESCVGLGESGALFAPNLVRLEQVAAVNQGNSYFKAHDGAMKRREPDGDSSNRLSSDNIPAANDNKKRLKTAGSREMNYESKTGAEQQNSQPPKQDCIHVRARRGQATDSHSLAERARREKISERMKVLQDLVPGCSKVIGKAMVLDEIINYVQSLQSQVEFLSMKLEAVNSRVCPWIEVLPPKDHGDHTFYKNTLEFATHSDEEFRFGTLTEWLHKQVCGASASERRHSLELQMKALENRVSSFYF